MVEKADLLTAIVTPFSDDGEVDIGRLKKLIQHLIDTGTNGFVVGGTTGETPTLSEDEKLKLYGEFGKIVGDKYPVIAGTGSNNTQQTAEFNQKVMQLDGIDYGLVVVPYYNKPNQRGMKEHFKYVADHSDKPIIIYNIPGRTGVNMDKETVVELSEYNNIAGIKQCGSLPDMEYIISNTPDDFLVYSGEDPQALATKMLGGDGVISVASHVYGDQLRAMYDDLDHGDYQAAGKLQRWLTPKMQALFMFPSPSPTKAALNANGLSVGGCRLPIATLNRDEKEELAQALDVNSLGDILND